MMLGLDVPPTLLARAASGHAAAPPPRSVMNSRRFTRSPRPRIASSFDGTSDRVPWRTLALLRSGLRDLLANDYAATYPDASFVATIFARR